MTVLEDRRLAHRNVDLALLPGATGRPVGGRCARQRPAGAPLQFRGSGIAVSCAPHTRRPVSTAVTVMLAGLSALITLWLGTLAQFSSERVAAPASGPLPLGVVEVQLGETLEQLAGRVAPDAPVGQIAEQIRDLNKLYSASLDAGRTLIAPIG